jgi:hypothetical protein
LIANTISEIDPDEIDTGELELLSGEPETPAAEEPPQIVEPLVNTDTDEQFLLTEEDEESADAHEVATYTSSSVVVPAQAQSQESDFNIFGNQGTDTYHEAQAQDKGGAGRILISLGLLVLGAAIAVAASYFLGFTGQDQQVVDAPQVETMKTQNIPLTSFEEARRIVDNDPAGYSTKTATPTDAADFYLLGRALLLTGKTNEAKRQFELARERLPQVDEAERKTLSNEITFALATIDNPEAVKNITASTQNNVNANSIVP